MTVGGCEKQIKNDKEKVFSSLDSAKGNGDIDRF
jgi:hypothetical protein